MSSDALKPYSSVFKGKTKLTSAEFVEVFKRYDKDGNGFIEASELDLFLKDLSSCEEGEGLDKKGLQEFKESILEKYDENADSRIEMSELAKILPAEENFLFQFRKNVRISCVEFMKIWYHYDTDKSGFLESKELDGFLHDLLLVSEKPVNPQRIQDYRTVILEFFDMNKDGKIEISEMSKILPVEENFLQTFENRKDLTREDFNQIFNHYDKDGNGYIEDCELIAFLRDVSGREGKTPNTVELEKFRTTILQLCDTNKDGKLSQEELGLLLSK